MHSMILAVVGLNAAAGAPLSPASAPPALAPCSLSGTLDASGLCQCDFGFAGNDCSALNFALPASDDPSALNRYFGAEVG